MSGVARYVGATIVAALAVGSTLSGCHHQTEPLHTLRAHACAQWGGEYTYTPQTNTYACEFPTVETPQGMCDADGGSLALAPGVDGRYVCTVTR